MLDLMQSWSAWTNCWMCPSPSRPRYQWPTHRGPATRRWRWSQRWHIWGSRTLHWCHGSSSSSCDLSQEDGRRSGDLLTASSITVHCPHNHGPCRSEIRQRICLHWLAANDDKKPDTIVTVVSVVSAAVPLCATDCTVCLWPLPCLHTDTDSAVHWL